MTRVYFYCRDDVDILQEDIIALAEGFRELGVEFYGNCNYWRERPDSDATLIRHSPEVQPGDCDIVVVGSFLPQAIHPTSYVRLNQPLPGGLFDPARKYITVYMDHDDGHKTVSWNEEYRAFDLILRAKLNRRANRPENMRPWALGLNRRILDATTDTPPFDRRARRLLVNFGASHPYEHGTRRLAEQTVLKEVARVLPIDRQKDDLSREPEDRYEALMWRQTGHRFSRSYYERLKRAQAVACFCGELIPSLPFDPQTYLVGGNKARLRRRLYAFLSVFDRRPSRSVQWDSFRFWETLAAGAVAINIDLERYGVDLPEMPINRVHYLGVDFDRPREIVELIRDEPHQLGAIAAEGRKWALQHYSPVATARRFLSLCGVDLDEAPPRASRVSQLSAV